MTTQEPTPLDGVIEITLDAAQIDVVAEATILELASVIEAESNMPISGSPGDRLRMRQACERIHRLSGVLTALGWRTDRVDTADRSRPTHETLNLGLRDLLPTANLVETYGLDTLDEDERANALTAARELAREYAA